MKKCKITTYNDAVVLQRDDGTITIQGARMPDGKDGFEVTFKRKEEFYDPPEKVDSNGIVPHVFGLSNEGLASLMLAANMAFPPVCEEFEDFLDEHDLDFDFIDRNISDPEPDPKTFTESDVLLALEDLLTVSGDKGTTTLDIKKLLRMRGFHATQEEVSSSMDDILSGRCGYRYNYTFNGKYRTYRRRDCVTLVGTWNFPGSGSPEPKKQESNVVEKKGRKYRVGVSKTSSVQVPEEIIVAGNRDEARLAFHKKHRNANVNYYDIRARLVSNPPSASR